MIPSEDPECLCYCILLHGYYTACLAACLPACRVTMLHSLYVLPKLSYTYMYNSTDNKVCAKICIKYRKHLKSWVNFQQTWKIGLIWAVLKLLNKSSKMTAISPAKIPQQWPMLYQIETYFLFTSNIVHIVFWILQIVIMILML